MTEEQHPINWYRLAFTCPICNKQTGRRRNETVEQAREKLARHIEREHGAKRD